MVCDEECIRNIVKEELANFQPQKSSKKGNKKKSDWNIFLADCTKKQPNGTPLGDRTKACSVEYKKLKSDGSLNNVISRLLISNGTSNDTSNGTSNDTSNGTSDNMTNNNDSKQ